MVAVILFRLNVHGSGYVSPDSQAYLDLAQNIKDGHGFYVPNEGTAGRHYFSAWPVGYPVLIYLFSQVTSLDVYWASKILNLLFIGAGFLLLRHLCRQYAFVLASVYGAYTYLEVYSFTWSEAPFLLGLLLLAYVASQVWAGRGTNGHVLVIFLICLSLFLLRYVGAFSFGVPALLGLYWSYKRKYKVAGKLLVVTTLLALLAAAYLYTNYRLSGFITGFDRLKDETESAGGFVLMLLKGLFNEFLVIREYRAQNQPDYLLYTTALLQLLLLLYIVVQVRTRYSFWQEAVADRFSAACFGVAFLYLGAILALRIVSRFDELDYRLLSPFSFPVFIGLLYTLVKLPDASREIVRVKYALFCFFVLSLLVNVPKNYVVSQLQQLL
ncbi:hypothetical protein CA264_16680 [Pontibacter actiniarum]|uniref:Glycosyltransferase RgtA/B/C/D-like domain-containing protein n=2 Tax=Pontibacter actiniarum TaxID=323450 RepID=A0A1X9YVU0_9BACT|nr:hypothetical protein CA264_16680 [Pontibacter actiniarum]